MKRKTIYTSYSALHSLTLSPSISPVLVLSPLITLTLLLVQKHTEIVLDLESLLLSFDALLTWPSPVLLIHLNKTSAERCHPLQALESRPKVIRLHKISTFSTPSLLSLVVHYRFNFHLKLYYSCVGSSIISLPHWNLRFTKAWICLAHSSQWIFI